MLTKSPEIKQQNLYHEDFYLWIQTTIQQLKTQNFQAVDLHNLLEELTDLGNERKSELESRLMVLFEHLLKLAYWQEERNYNQRGWKGTIREQRKKIKRLLQKNPSLKPYLVQVFEECYLDARDITLDKTGLNTNILPLKPIVTIEQSLDETWLPLD